MEPLCQEWQYNQDHCGNMLCSSAKILKNSCPDGCTDRLEPRFIALVAMIPQDHFVREVLACEVPFQRESRACKPSTGQLQTSANIYSCCWPRHGRTLLAAFQTEDIRPRMFGVGTSGCTDLCTL